MQGKAARPQPRIAPGNKSRSHVIDQEHTGKALWFQVKKKRKVKA